MAQITVGQALKMAHDHKKAGRTAEAEAVCRKLLSRKPDQPDALHLLGYLTANRNSKEGADMIRRAIAINPGNANYHNNLGCVLFADKQLDEAIAAWRNAISIQPDSVEAYNNLAGALLGRGDADQAVQACERAVELDSASHRAWFTLGNTLRFNHRCDEAEKAYRRAIALKPDFGECLTNLGMALRDQGRFDDARNIFLRAIAMKPDSANDHWNYALTLLRAGDYSNGFLEYEWRWHWEGFPDKRQEYPQPQWLGSDLAGKTIFVHCEQGFGDLIQMARYVPLLAQRGARVILGCQPEMRRLMSTLDGKPQIRVTGEPIGSFDLHIPAMSLPLAFETTADTVPAVVPYLLADFDLSSTWAKRMKVDAGHLRVGVVWAGQAKHGDDRRRSLTLEALAPLTRIDRVRFFSLQKGPAAGQIASWPSASDAGSASRTEYCTPEKTVGGADPTKRGEEELLQLTHFGPDLKDFADTAAVIANLDLVITVDTAVAHLAGAMGKRCWVLLASVPDWRWLLNRDDSPWYPTVRLFRQQPGQTWEPVIARMARELACR